MHLYQHRGSAFGGWAAGLLATGSGWQIEPHRGNESVDLEVKTPVGGVFIWIRFW